MSCQVTDMSVLREDTKWKHPSGEVSFCPFGQRWSERKYYDFDFDYDFVSNLNEPNNVCMFFNIKDRLVVMEESVLLWK